MAITNISLSELHARSLADLGLTAKTENLLTTETLAALLRRVAELNAPCPGRLIVGKVLDALKGVAEDSDQLQEQLENLLERLINYGDLFEFVDFSQPDSIKKRLVYAAPKSFLMRESGQFLLIGVFDAAEDPIFEDFPIELIWHIRRISAGENKLAVRKSLLASGFVERSYKTWISMPPQESAQEIIARLNTKLAEEKTCGSIPGLKVIGPEKSVRFYPKRWDTGLKGRAGNVVAKRPQSYGSDIWCYVEIQRGIPQRFIDLPTSDNWHGWDEAWHIQMAIDFLRKSPQQYRLRPGKQGEMILDFFSPIPVWTQRRLDTIGLPTAPLKCLLSYSIPEIEVPEEIRLLENSSWLARVDEGISND